MDRLARRLMHGGEGALLVVGQSHGYRFGGGWALVFAAVWSAHCLTTR